MLDVHTNHLEVNAVHDVSASLSLRDMSALTGISVSMIAIRNNSGGIGRYFIDLVKKINDAARGEE